MARLPVVSGLEMVKVASKLGFMVLRQKGSHVILRRADRLLTIPLHATLKKGTLLQILRTLEISRERLADLL